MPFMYSTLNLSSLIASFEFHISELYIWAHNGIDSYRSDDQLIKIITQGDLRLTLIDQLCNIMTQLSTENKLLCSEAPKDTLLD